LVIRKLLAVLLHSLQDSLLRHLVDLGGCADLCITPTHNTSETDTINDKVA
jgi:hypothetical protein